MLLPVVASLPIVCVTPLAMIAVPDVTREYVVPETAIAPPGTSVWEPATKSEAEIRVTVSPPIITMGGAVCWPPTTAVMYVVCPLITNAIPDGARERVDPDTVIAEPPGDSVWDPKMYCEAEFIVTVSSPTVMIGGEVS